MRHEIIRIFAMSSQPFKLSELTAVEGQAKANPPQGWAAAYRAIGAMKRSGLTKDLHALSDVCAGAAAAAPPPTFEPAQTSCLGISGALAPTSGIFVSETAPLGSV